MRPFKVGRCKKADDETKEETMNIPQSVDLFLRKKWKRFLNELAEGEFVMPFRNIRDVKAMRATAYKINMENAGVTYSVAIDTKEMLCTITKHTEGGNNKC